MTAAQNMPASSLVAFGILLLANIVVIAIAATPAFHAFGPDHFSDMAASAELGSYAGKTENRATLSSSVTRPPPPTYPASESPPSKFPPSDSPAVDLPPVHA